MPSARSRPRTRLIFPAVPSGIVEPQRSRALRSRALRIMNAPLTRTVVVPDQQCEYAQMLMAPALSNVTSMGVKEPSVVTSQRPLEQATSKSLRQCQVSAWTAECAGAVFSSEAVIASALATAPPWTTAVTNRPAASMTIRTRRDLCRRTREVSPLIAMVSCPCTKPAPCRSVVMFGAHHIREGTHCTSRQIMTGIGAGRVSRTEARGPRPLSGRGRPARLRLAVHRVTTVTTTWCPGDVRDNRLRYSPPFSSRFVPPN
jgi:hypothetical protein